MAEKTEEKLREKSATCGFTSSALEINVAATGVVCRKLVVSTATRGHNWHMV